MTMTAALSFNTSMEHGVTVAMSLTVTASNTVSTAPLLERVHIWIS